MNIGTWNALLVVALLIVLSGGGYILYQTDVQKRADIAQEQARITAQEKEELELLAKEKLGRLQAFEDFLNDFLGDVHGLVQVYKKNRTVFNELGALSNLRSPEYIAENASMAESTVMSLQLQMDDIMGVFEKADEQGKKLIHQFDESMQAGVQKKWVDVRDENVEKYTAFFSTEQDVLIAKLKLIEFYAEHRDILSVDLENDRVLFDSVELQEQEALLRGEVIRLKSAQKIVMKAQTAD